MPCSAAVVKQAAAVLALLLLAAHTAAAQRPGQGTRMTNGMFRQSGASVDKPVAIAGAPDGGDVSTSAVAVPAAVTVAAATGKSSINTENAYDLCYDLNANRTLAFMDVGYFLRRPLNSNEFIADTTCYLQWLPVSRVANLLLSCDCLDPQKCGKLGQQPCCRNFNQWRAASNWAMTSSYIWKSQPASNMGDGYVCEWILTRPTTGYGIMVATVSYSVVTLSQVA